jgi:hypothetical protein
LRGRNRNDPADPDFAEITNIAAVHDALFCYVQDACPIGDIVGGWWEDLTRGFMPLPVAR